MEQKPNITQSLTFNGSCGSGFLKHVIVTTSSFVEWDHLKKIIIHNENGVNQKDNILLKPFLYLITQPLRNKQKECNTCIYGIIKAFPYFCITSYNHENIAKPKELWKAIKSL